MIAFRAKSVISYSQTVFRISLESWLMCVAFWMIVCNQLLWVSPLNLMCCFTVSLCYIILDMTHDYASGNRFKKRKIKPFLQNCLWRNLELLREQLNHSLPSLAYIKGNYFNLKMFSALNFFTLWWWFLFRIMFLVIERIQLKFLKL